jgi:hypothetical protein
VMQSMFVKEIELLGKDIFVFLHNKEAPEREPWTRTMEQFEAYAIKHERDISRLCVLVFSDGGGPDAVQRDQLKQFYKKYGAGVRSSIISDSTLVRGVVTALSWLNPVMKAFSPKDLRAALNHIGLGEKAGPEVLRLVAKWQEDEGAPPVAVAKIAASVLPRAQESVR